MMQYHYGPTPAATTSYGAPRKNRKPLRGLGETVQYGLMRTTPIPVGGNMSGDNYVYGPMRTTPHAVGDITSSMNSAVKQVLEFGSGFVVGQMVAPTAKDKVLYGVGGGLVTLMFGVTGLGVAALVLQHTQK